MTAPTVNRRDISVTEEREYETGLTVTSITEENATRTTWTAALEGRLSDGVYASMSRHGATSKDALEALTEAIAAEGWAIKDQPRYTLA